MTSARSTSRSRCECGYELLVFGRGRHRVFFELDDATLTNPVMDGACPRCHRRFSPDRHALHARLVAA